MYMQSPLGRVKESSSFQLDAPGYLTGKNLPSDLNFIDHTRGTQRNILQQHSMRVNKVALLNALNALFAPRNKVKSIVRCIFLALITFSCLTPASRQLKACAQGLLNVTFWAACPSSDAAQNITLK